MDLKTYEGRLAEFTDDLTRSEHTVKVQIANARDLVKKLVEQEFLSTSEFADASICLLDLRGQHQAVQLAIQAIGYDGNLQDAIDDLIDALCYGAEDTYSGRGNDLRRAYHDGLRRNADKIIRDIRYVEELKP